MPDVYFCPERHGTYFGSFFIKDAPAVGHPGYSIDETMTATVGSAPGYIVVGTVRVQVPACTVVTWNGAKTFAVGQNADYQGYASGSVTVAQKVVLN